MEFEMDIPKFEPLIKYEEAAGLLGIAQITLRKWVSQDKVPYYKLGRCVRFRRSELQEWLNEQYINPV